MKLKRLIITLLAIIIGVHLALFIMAGNTVSPGIVVVQAWKVIALIAIVTALIVFFQVLRYRHLRALYRKAKAASEQGDITQCLRLIQTLEQRGKPRACALTLSGDLLLTLACKEADAPDAALLQQAAARYQSALDLKSDNHKARYQLGTTQLRQAKHADAAEAQELLAKAIEHFAHLTRVAPKAGSSWAKWGIALVEQARYAEDEKAQALYAQADDKFQQAVTRRPDVAEFHVKWAWTLMQQAKRQVPPQRQELRRQAEAKFLQAEKHK